ncbi:MAG: N-acetylmuramoyl-L-alanine amidase [Chitinophagales bacterium]|nr:N-acetylmuramoyl-L-alanine amidase [Chitinophagales bacterium]
MPLRFLALLLIICCSARQGYTQERKVAKIVIDPGHGGDKPGAIGHFTKEKDLALAISLKLGEIIRKNLKDREVIFTRTTDVDVHWAERHEIANRAKANLFVSVHINSTPPKRRRIKSGGKYRTVYDKTTDANGTEVLVLGLTRVSQKEESIGEYSENITEEDGLLDEKDPMTAIIIAQYSEAFLRTSVDIGNYILDEFSSQGRLNRGVKQKSLEVLAGCVMPGVLVECGFINNVEEEKYMNSPQGQTEIAMAIYKGILKYIKAVER